jgi:hypothetical protein
VVGQQAVGVQAVSVQAVSVQAVSVQAVSVQGVQGVDLLSRITGGRLYVDDVPIEQVEAAIK